MGGDARKTRVLIIGSGPAGYTAAIYAARAMLAPLVIEGLQPGGQLTITTDVENWPGDASVLGPELMQRMRAHAVEMGAEVASDVVARLDLSRRPFRASLDSGGEIDAETVILATGAQAKWLGVPGEDALRGRGVSACATCDGFFYRGKRVAVIGGGNTAAEEALFLTHFADHVTVVHRRDRLRAEKILQERLFKNPKIDMLWSHEVTKILGDGAPGVVRALCAAHVETGETRELAVDGVFMAVGHAPASALVADQVETHSGGYVRIRDGSTATSVPGVFAAGDVTDHVYRQAVTSAGMGCMAALDAERYISAR